jgi:crotonobetainyl-CoA:carnitine CoA-transferase CaiB-like acyl-CoA transferase
MKPLSGFRILDLTTNISGPFASMILSDLGAEVIKIERVEIGDDARHMSPFFGQWSAYFVGINRSKKSVAINFKEAAGIQIIHELAQNSDVVMQNFRGSKAKNMSMGYEDFKKIREDIIYCSISAYGQVGPLVEDPGYDALVQARSGLISINGANSEDLARVGVSLLDMSSGMWAAIAIQSALLQRALTGKGQEVSTSLYESGIMWGLYHQLYYQALGRNPEPQGTRHTAFAPYGAYDTATTKVFVGISNDRLFEKFCRAMERPEWLIDERFARNALRLEYRTELEQMINELMKQESAEVWLVRFDEVGVPASQVKRISEVMVDPQVEALRSFIPIPVDGYGDVKVPKLPLVMGNEDFSDLQAPPRLGQHTADVLKQLGYTDPQIEQLANQKVISLDHVNGMQK